MRKTKKPVVTLAGLLQAVAIDEAKSNKENDKNESKPICHSPV